MPMCTHGGMCQCICAQIHKCMGPFTNRPMHAYACVGAGLHSWMHVQTYCYATSQASLHVQIHVWVHVCWQMHVQHMHAPMAHECTHAWCIICANMQQQAAVLIACDKMWSITVAGLWWSKHISPCFWMPHGHRIVNAIICRCRMCVAVHLAWVWHSWWLRGSCHFVLADTWADGYIENSRFHSAVHVGPLYGGMLC